MSRRVSFPRPPSGFVYPSQLTPQSQLGGSGAVGGNQLGPLLLNAAPAPPPPSWMMSALRPDTRQAIKTYAGKGQRKQPSSARGEGASVRPRSPDPTLPHAPTPTVVHVPSRVTRVSPAATVSKRSQAIVDAASSGSVVKRARRARVLPPPSSARPSNSVDEYDGTPHAAAELRALLAGEIVVSPHASDELDEAPVDFIHREGQDLRARDGEETEEEEETQPAIGWADPPPHAVIMDDASGPSLQRLDSELSPVIVGGSLEGPYRQPRVDVAPAAAPPPPVLPIVLTSHSSLPFGSSLAPTIITQQSDVATLGSTLHDSPPRLSLRSQDDVLPPNQQPNVLAPVPYRLEAPVLHQHQFLALSPELVSRSPVQPSVDAGEEAPATAIHNGSLEDSAGSGGGNSVAQYDVGEECGQGGDVPIDYRVPEESLTPSAPVVRVEGAASEASPVRGASIPSAPFVTPQHAPPIPPPGVEKDSEQRTPTPAPSPPTAPPIRRKGRRAATQPSGSALRKKVLVKELARIQDFLPPGTQPREQYDRGLEGVRPTTKALHLFARLRFLITGFSSSPDLPTLKKDCYKCALHPAMVDVAKSDITAAIASHGGTLLHQLSDVKKGDGQLIIIANPTSYRTVKYQYALAIGQLPVDVKWLFDCITANTVLDRTPYELPLGNVRGVGLKVRLSGGGHEDATQSSEDPLRVLSAASSASESQRVLAGLHMCLFSEESADGATLYEEWEAVLAAAGADVIPLASLTSGRPSNKRSRDPVPIVVVLPNLSLSDQDRYTALRTRAKHAITVTSDWVVQSLTIGAVQRTELFSADAYLRSLFPSSGSSRASDGEVGHPSSVRWGSHVYEVGESVFCEVAHGLRVGKIMSFAPSDGVSTATVHLWSVPTGVCKPPCVKRRGLELSGTTLIIPMSAIVTKCLVMPPGTPNTLECRWNILYQA